MIKIHTLTPKVKGLFCVKYEYKKSILEVDFHQETVFKHKLKPSLELSKKTFDAIVEEDMFIQAYAFAINQLAYKNHTKKSLRTILKSKNIPSPIIDRVIDQLHKDNYLDEAKQLDFLIKEFVEYELKGPKWIEQKLLNQGYRDIDIKEHLSKQDASLWEKKCKDYLTQVSEQRPLESKRSRDQFLKQKAYAQGFSLELALEVIERIDYPYDESDVLKEKLERYQKQYNINNPTEQRRLIQKLQREGFHFHDIKKHLK